ncbi:XRE family transcriptional regulator [Nocardia sp. NBC_01377]|uniref:XRE family transcriptional regulator n=1 Tax=Nocardia sp. NBC_01377 TaxID=2903595 RepID=UPI0032476BE9
MTRPGALAAARERLIGILHETIGPQLTTEAAQTMLEQAKAWSPGGARTLDRHIAEHPDAFLTPSPHCPTSLPRLLRALTASGFGDKVVLLGCARCGRTDVVLNSLTPDGRCCPRCAVRLRPCARCHSDGEIVARRREGPICRRCYTKDPEFITECAGCGRIRIPAKRLDNGDALCQTCIPKQLQPCSHCGRTRPVHAHTLKGPTCRSCHTTPPRLCGVCGQIRPIGARADGNGRPDICRRCYRHLGDCVVCGRHRHGSNVGGGQFQCSSCSPRPVRACALCGATAITNTTWPLGPVCRRCYYQRRANPAPCRACGHTRVLVGPGDICAVCAGTDLDLTCRTCGKEGHNFFDGRCEGCVATQRIHDLLSDKDGTLLPALQPLAQALTTAHPSTVLTWLQRSASSLLLAGLVVDRVEISHAVLDRLPQDASTRRVRDLLVTTAILQPRNENLAQLQLWVERTTPTLPPQHQPVIRAFAEWYVLRRARQRADRRPYREAAAAQARYRIRTAALFLQWLDTTDTPLADLTQHHIDTWFDANPGKCGVIVVFLDWLRRRHLIGDIDIPRRKDSLPRQFHDQHEQESQLRRCLTDDSIPLPVRVAGALIRLYALSLVRIVEITADQLHRDDTHSYLHIDQHPVILPPTLSRLFDQLITQGGLTSMVRHVTRDQPTYLFRGRPGGRPRNSAGLAVLLKEHGLPSIAARNTAMMANITDLDAAVVSDLFGIHPATAHRWARFAKTSWADYLSHAP